MKHKRLAGLLVVLALVGVMRVLDPVGKRPPEIAEPVVRAPVVPRVEASRSDGSASQVPETETHHEPAAPAETASMLGNPFESRLPPVPVAPPIAPVVPIALPPRVVAVVIPQAPPPPPQDPAPPFQVIGSWDDGKTPGAFVVTPAGTLLAKKGELLQSEYRVVEVNRQTLVLQNVATKRDYTLVVPR